MSFTRVQRGESPAMVARRLNTSVGALMAANRHKPTTTVSGRHTWQGVGIGELLIVPRAGVGVGDPGMLGAIAPADPNAPHATIRQGSPTSADVALWQTIIGVTADGIFGPKTAAATKAWQGTHGLTADGIVGPKTWAAALGHSAPATTVAPAPSTAAPAPIVAPSSSLLTAAHVALTALSNDPNYCASVAKTGTTVNTAVHNFKAAWNAANPSRAVPIGTGKYEVVVAAALWSALGGTVDVPPGCGAATAGMPVSSAPQVPAPAMPSLPAPVVTPLPGSGQNPPPVAAPSAPSAVPSAVQALTSFNPCVAENVSLVRQAQSALGVAVDGKYGPGTASAAQRLVPGAPAGCSPRPAWWTPPGQSNAPGGGSAGPTPPPAPPPPAPILAPGGTITPPEAKKKLSTGAIVAGAVGAAALVGLAAVAMSKKPGHRGARGARGPSRRKKSTHKKRKSSKRKKH